MKADYDWTVPDPTDGLLNVHRRAAINLLLGALRLGDANTIARAYCTVTAFVLRTQPSYTPLDAAEVTELLCLFEAMPGGLRTRDEIRLETMRP